MFELGDKTALVIGGRGFLGRRFSNALVDAGARVVSADLVTLSRAAATDDSTPAKDEGNILQLNVDVTNPESVNRVVSETLANVCGIDILVYCVTAKPDDFYKPFTECSLPGWQSVIRAELDGLFLVTQQVGKVMEDQKRGSMIFLSSIYGVVGNDQRIYQGSNLDEVYLGQRGTAQRRIFAHPVYSVAKGGVISFTRFLAAYWGDKNIRVNCISPGGVAHVGENEEFVRRYSDKVPLGRKADPDEVTGAVLFLASDASSYVTGHNLVVDGGWTAW
ncbi:MAG TPA: SDR family oxidoreductase [Pyrinomonadaceae bacterium]|nr:SDR family oxidoreductase [Pyrinomonadaceae bacterium]